jgi:probable H4MPT-linked C1 transfer pathway protein
VAAVIGWDIGGAHVKAARVAEGRVTAAVQVPCPLWLGLEQLPDAIASLAARLGPAGLHAATMTGELADAFADRAEGVAHIAVTLVRTLAPAPVRLYAGRDGLIDPAAAAGAAASVASANWHATASLAARASGAALLVDMGSTTTDLVPLAQGAVVAMGATDAERLACGELVYTGLVRSALMAVAERAPFAGAWVPLAAEYFATIADCHRLLGTLPEAADQMPTADGREKSLGASRARLARMVGRDAAEADEAAWRDLAAFFAEAQMRRIEDAARLVLSRARLAPDAPVLGAGCGRAMTQRLAARLGRSWRDFAALPEFAGAAPEVIDQCAPAAAVALLASVGPIDTGKSASTKCPSG